MENFSYTLSPDHFVQVFPFHLVLNPSLQIIQAGHTLQQLTKKPLVGDKVDEHFILLRPKISWSWEQILKKQQSLFVLSAKQSAVSFKGQMIHSDGVLFFLGSVWVHRAGELKPLGLKLQDFALHDTTTDFLVLQRTSQIALEDAQALTQQLQTQKEQVETLLQQQENLAKEAHERAQVLEQTLQNLHQTQLHLVQAEKMSALGQLMAGIAHEINNPLAFISGNLDYLKTDIANLLKFARLYRTEGNYLSPNLEQAFEALDFDFLEADLPKLMHSLQTGSDRITEIVNALRNFSRFDEMPIQDVNIHEGLDNSLQLLRHRTKAQSKRVAIITHKHYSHALPRIECFAGQLNQVFMNILANAIDVLEEHPQETPTITIATTQTSVDSIQIAIADNGPGIPPEIQTKIFDPFFTTKPIGKGTGLGMSISRQIVMEHHGGQLYFQTSPQTGTKFFIELPVSQSN